jgi:hypothetical protein
MLADIILDSSALHTLSLADNGLDDAAVVAVMEAVKANELVALQELNLAGNSIGAAVRGRRRRAGLRCVTCWMCSFAAGKPDRTTCSQPSRCRWVYQLWW